MIASRKIEPTVGVDADVRDVEEVPAAAGALADQRDLDLAVVGDAPGADVLDDQLIGEGRHVGGRVDVAVDAADDRRVQGVDDRSREAATAVEVHARELLFAYLEP